LQDHLNVESSPGMRLS